MKKNLLVIIPDHLSVLIKKGEVVEKYYNPGNLFDEVHIMMVNDDKPDLKAVQFMVGNAKLYIHNHPEPPFFFKKTLGWQPFLMSKWLGSATNTIRKISPNIIRCHGAHLNAYIAYQAKKKLGIPYVISLHTNADEGKKIDLPSFKEKIVTHCLKKLELTALKNAELVMPVYEAIIPYLTARSVNKYQVCYNVLNGKNLTKKEDYTLSSIVKVLCIGRQFRGKEPFNLISALKYFEQIQVTFIGDGEYHEKLIEHAKEEKVTEKTRFIKSLINDELCNLLSTSDFLAIHTDYFELSKVMLESFLAGLPVLLNYRPGQQVPELTDQICLRVENSIEGYKIGITKLIQDHLYREELGNNAYKVAQKKWASRKCEEAYVNIYKQYMLS